MRVPVVRDCPCGWLAGAGSGQAPAPRLLSLLVPVLREPSPAHAADLITWHTERAAPPQKEGRVHPSRGSTSSSMHCSSASPPGPAGCGAEQGQGSTPVGAAGGWQLEREGRRAGRHSMHRSAPICMYHGRRACCAGAPQGSRHRLGRPTRCLHTRSMNFATGLQQMGVRRRCVAPRVVPPAGCTPSGINSKFTLPSVVRNRGPQSAAARGAGGGGGRSGGAVCRDCCAPRWRVE